MSTKDKQIQRFLNRPKDFTWQELKKILAGFGYRETAGGKTGGSRGRFVHHDGSGLFLHKPHPGSILKRYQIDQVIAFLKQENLL